jgi:ankyrin repeat protein
VNLVESQNGNTALHLASMIGRADVVHDLLSIPSIDDHIRNAEGLDPLEVSKTPEIAQIFQGMSAVAKVTSSLLTAILSSLSRGA